MKRVLLWLIALPAIAVAQSVTPVQMPEGVRVRDTAYADVNADGRQDLVISTWGSVLELRIHLHREGARPFIAEPDHLLSPIWKDVVAFAVADVHPDAGAEVVLLTSKGIWAWRPTAGEKERAVKLIECTLLWQLPFQHGPLHWQHAIQDLDGDGRADLAIPEPGGYLVSRQTAPGEFSTPQELIVPAVPSAKRPLPVTDRRSARRMRERMEVQFSSGGGLSVESLRDSGALVEVNDTLPAPQFRDFDADGDLDLIVRTRRWIHVWLQIEPGQFSVERRRTYKAPVEADLARKLEVSYSAHVLDLDGDRRADFVMFSGDQRSKDVRTQVQFFRQEDDQEPVFGKRGLPDQLLVLSGFAGSPQFDDVDGDGDPDMLVGALRPDLLDSLRGSGKTSVDIELYLYRNERGVFSRKPDLAYRTELQAEGLRYGRKGAMARFFGDASGDGIADLLVRDQAGRIRVLLTRRSRRGWSIHSQPLWELRIAPNSWIVVGAYRGKRKAPDLLVLEDEQVLHVRFP